jgi:hypothetical protein
LPTVLNAKPELLREFCDETVTKVPVVKGPVVRELPLPEK